MNYRDLDLRPDDRKLRHFGLIVLAVAAGAAFWQGLSRHHLQLMIILGTVSLISGSLALVRPAMLKPVYVVLTVVTFPLGWLSSRLLLAAAFYLVFSPAALVMRLLRRDRLRRTLDRKAATYWNPKVTPSDVESYFRQY